MAPSPFSPAERRLLRGARIAGWALAALLLAGVTAGVAAVGLKLDSQQRDEAALTRRFLDRVETCLSPTPRRERTMRDWDRCVDQVVRQRWDQ